MTQKRRQLRQLNCSSDREIDEWGKCWVIPCHEPGDMRNDTPYGYPARLCQKHYDEAMKCEPIKGTT